MHLTSYNCCDTKYKYKIGKIYDYMEMNIKECNWVERRIENINDVILIPLYYNNNKSTSVFIGTIRH